MKKKEIKITEKEQRVAVDILQELEAYMMSAKEVPEEVVQIFNNMCKKYELCENPFTRMICTTKEWAKNSLEYDRQIMMERYGHCDGLD